jgi:hypothetical protein
MVKYTVRLRGYSETVDVPTSVKGVDDVAAYIARYLGEKYARAIGAKNILGATENWADSHYDFIFSEIERMARGIGEAQEEAYRKLLRERRIAYEPEE